MCDHYHLCAKAIGNHLSKTKDINLPIGNLTQEDLVAIAKIVLKAWQYTCGCSDEEVPYA